MDPTIEALTIHPAAWAAMLQGLAEGLAYGAAVVGGVLVASVVSIACLGGREAAEDDRDAAREQESVATAGQTPRVSRARRRRRICRRARGPWIVIVRQPEPVG